MSIDYYFIIDKYCKEIKQHLNLSENAWIIIDEDMKNFYETEEQQSFSGFLNKIFKNFYQTANASINNRLIEKIDELESLYSSDEFKNCDQKTIKMFINKLANVYVDELNKKAHSYPKGEGKKFRIDKDSIEILRESLDASYYEGMIGEYLKAIFEEYCSKPAYIREQIFFLDIFEKIEKAIYRERKLKITQINRTTVKGDKKYNQKFYFSPYKIIQNKVNTYNYLIGFSEEINDQNSTVGVKHISCLRLSRIAKADIMISMGAHISKDHAKEIENEIVEKGAEFMTGKIQDIIVKFTEKGLEKFRRQIYLRPQFYKVSKEDKHIYSFKCTDRQAYNYFWKFGWDVEIIEPQYLHDIFREHYENAVKVYNGISKEEQIASKE